MAQMWYYRAGGAEHGPVAAAELKRLASAGEIGPADVVRREEMEKWMAAGQVKGLFAAPAVVAPSPQGDPAPRPTEPVARTVTPPPPLPPDDGGDGPASATRREAPAGRGTRTPVVIAAALGGLLLLALVVTGAVLLLGGKRAGDTADPQAREPVANPGGSAAPVPARRIAEDYDKGRTSADARYKGQTLLVEGVIDIPYDGQGFATVHLEVPDALKSHPMVTASFGAKHEAELKKLRRGEAIRFRGLCKGDVGDPKYTAHVSFIDCELLNPNTVKEQGRNTPGGSVRGSYTGRAEKLTGRTARIKHPAGSQEDFIAALRLVAPGEVGERVREKGRVWMASTLWCEQADYREVFGEPEPLPDRVESVGTSVIESQRWQHKCTDGYVMLSGRVIDAQGKYMVAGIVLKSGAGP